MSATEVVAALLSQHTFADFVNRIETNLRDPIADYLKSVPNSFISKAVKDSVWGMIDLHDQEVIILDSPPLQRLRFVKQLGLTFLTYPTASYSRFEHTLGAMHQAERMLRAIAGRSEGATEILSDINTVRLSAILHDIGHLPFSHVSERYYSEKECLDIKLLTTASKVREEVSKTLPARLPRLTECLSLAVALTPSFKKLLSKANYTEEQVAIAVLSIVGRPPSLEKAYLAQIITNIIDADKLDYMFRDALATGVPLAVDLERLLFKLRCLPIEPSQCPKHLQMIFSDKGQARILGTDLVGLRHAHDIALSRSMLFERIYHHHKTLAAERVVLELLNNLNSHPADLLQEDDRLFSRYGIGGKNVDNAELVAMLDLRRLPKRVFAIQYSPLIGPPPLAEQRPVVSEQDRDGWNNLINQLNNPQQRKLLQKEIESCTSTLAKMVGIQLSKFKVWLDSPPEPYELPEVDLLVQRPDGTIIKGDSFPAEAAAFAHNPETGAFIYTTGANLSTRELIFLAIEHSLATSSKPLFFGRAAADFAKISWQNVEELKRKIETVDRTFFNSCRRTRPKSEFLRKEHTRQRVEALAAKFGHYHIHTKIHLDMNRIQLFFDQFPENLVDGALKLLEGITFLDRTELGKGLATTLGTATDNTCYVPLQEELDKSAQHISYFLADVQDGPKAVKLKDALSTSDRIIFFDDCLLSATQAIAVVKKWFGLPTISDDKLTIQLSPEEQNLLKSKKVAFRFLYATNDGIDSLSQLTSNLELGNDIKATSTIVTGKKPIDELLDSGIAKQMRDFLGEVGQALLKSTKQKKDPSKWTEDRCKSFALGYGGLEQLLVFAYNTPTGTITPLWKAGDYCGVPWLPLFPRRGEVA